MQAEQLPLLTPDGNYFSLIVPESDALALRAYWQAVREALSGILTNDLERFLGVEVQDEDGRRYALLTDLDRLHAFFAQLTNDEHQELSRIFDAERPEPDAP